MKYNVLIIGLLVVGCGKTELSEVEKLEGEKIVGSYEEKEDGNTIKLVLLEYRVVKISVNGVKIGEGTWKIVGKEVHIGYGLISEAYKMESNGDLTVIAIIKDGKREDYPKEKQIYFKKIK